MLALFRTNPGLLVGVILIAMSTLLLGSFGFWMARSGASLRPIIWMGGFFALIIVPQFIGHLVIAVRRMRAEAPRAAAMGAAQSGPSTVETRRAAVASWAGSDVDPALVSDARTVFGEVFARAETAQFAVLPRGESVLFARFPGTLAAEKAWVGYLQSTGLALLGGKGDSQRGWAVTRPTGDRVFALHFGTCVGVWTGPDDLAIRRRMLAGGFEIPRRAPLDGRELVEAELPEAARPKFVAPIWKVLMGVALAAYVVFLAAYFCRGSSWAGGEAPVAGVVPHSRAAVEQAIAAAGSTPGAPFEVQRGTRAGEWLVTWRYGDATWIDLARAHGLKRTHRIRIVLDEATHTARVTDYEAALDWSAGQSGAQLAWKASSGIIFFKREQQRVLGWQLPSGPEASSNLNYSYSFDLQTLKGPFIAAVTQSGWAWRPVVWDAPRPLRWLTE